MNAATPTVKITQLSAARDARAGLIEDVREGLGANPKSLPSKYFYDDEGSRLFDEITELPEYYLPRAETEILAERAAAIVRDADPDEMVELGAGFSRKTRLLLEAMAHAHKHARFVPLDVSEEALRHAGLMLLADYPWLDFEGFVGDFENDIVRLPRHGRRLVTFLGSTIGNIHPEDRVDFFRHVTEGMHKSDSFLIGMDLVKDVDVLEAAYDDARGVTAAFNRNVLRVVNRELDADFDPMAFEHVAFFDRENSWIEMRLRATRAMQVTIPAADLELEFAEGEEIRTEISCKFTREIAESSLSAAGLKVKRWDTDEGGRFALALCNL